MTRQINALSGSYQLSAAGRSTENLHGTGTIRLIPRHRTLTDKIRGALLLKTRRFADYYWGLPDIRDSFQKLRGHEFHLIIANDVETLPLALRIAGNAKVLLDAHEYSPREYYDSLLWRFLSERYITSFLCTGHLNKVDAMMTVSEGIAQEYSNNFAVPKPFVVMNTPYYQELKPEPCGNPIRLIHHGTADPSRKLELMIKMMDYLDNRYALDFMLIDKNPGYVRRLKKLAAPNQRIHFIPPVPIEEIPKQLNRYDIGVYLLPPANLNSEKALPNKFFEFIQARLAVAIGPSSEMANYVRTFKCGTVSRDFSPFELALKLNALTVEKITQFKRGSHRAAPELCFERSETVFLNQVKTLLSS